MREAGVNPRESGSGRKPGNGLARPRERPVFLVEPSPGSSHPA